MSQKEINRKLEDDEEEVGSYLIIWYQTDYYGNRSSNDPIDLIIIIGVVLNYRYTYYATLTYYKKLGNWCFGRFVSRYRYFHYFLWDK
jgi:hypothetical protein